MRDPSLKPPRYQQLIDSLRRRIESGALPPGTRLPSFAEMRRTEAAGQSTVERVYASLEQDGLVERRQGSGVFVIERTGRRKTSTLAVLGFDPEESEGSHYWFQLMRGIRKGAARGGLDTLFPLSAKGLPWDKFDGVLLHGGATELLAKLPAGTPCVGLMATLPNMPSVLADHEDGIAQAVSHLVSLGHRRIGYLMWPEREPMRIRGYRNALAEAHIEVEPQWVRGMNHQPGNEAGGFNKGYTNMQRWLADGFLETGCTALLAHDDSHALGAVQALNDAGLQVPRDLSVVGYDGIDEATRGARNLTTVAVPFARIAETAVNLLAHRIRNEDVPNTKTLFQVSLRVGESTSGI